MKILLTLSLILNVVLAYFAVGKKETTPVMERVIIETHSEPRKVEIKETRGHVVESLKTPQKNAEEKDAEKLAVEPMTIRDINDVEVQDAGEKMERRRMEFLTHELGLSEEEVRKAQELKANFYQGQAKFWEGNKTGEFSFEQRREMIDMEEKLYQDMEKVFGKKRWERYQQFRERHNSRGLKKYNEGNDPFIFMGI